jgi:undecaprenyl-diphosphatase
MSLFQISVLALVQGITEFLPISSSGHLILVPAFTGWPDQGLLIDVAVHVGTLGAVVGYFSRDVAAMLRGLGDDWDGGLLAQPGRRLLAQLALGTAPVVAVGSLLAAAEATAPLRSIAVIGWTTLIFGLLLYAADRWGPRTRRMEGMTFTGALVIGASQVLALVPGTSRSGITMTAARMLGFEREDAARFSMLLAIPTIVAAGSLAVYEIHQLGQAELGAYAVLGAVLAFVSAWLTIALLMRWLQRASFTPFVVYRCALGLFLLAYAYG